MKLREVIELLSLAGVENPRHDARELFVKIGKVSREAAVLTDVECNSPELAFAVERRIKREPLQYILGEVNFYREVYTVNENCLIPRQDTEILVDYAVKNIPSGKTFVDLCTGSGCVAISTLKNTEKTHAVAVDISDSALDVAKLNAKKNGIADRIEFVSQDALNAPVAESAFAVLSNPPYVTEKEYEQLEPELYFEPKIAFVGGISGLDFYGRILDLYEDIIEPDGFFAFEIGYEQGEALKSIASLRNMSCKIIKDLSQNDRVAIIKRA